MTHTPGPWVVSKAKPTKTRGIDVLANAGTAHIVASIYQPAAIGDWNIQQIEQSRANARLIAAAPAMYEALKQIVAYADGSTDPGIVSVARAALVLVSDNQNSEAK
jgi:hypothetical protein